MPYLESIVKPLGCGFLDRDCYDDPDDEDDFAGIMDPEDFEDFI